MKINTLIQFVLYIVVTAALASTAFFLFPQVKAAHLEPIVAVAFASSITQLGAAAYFLLNIRTIKPGYKSAYVLFALGIVVFSILQILPPLTVLSSFVSNHAAWNVYIFAGSFIIGALLMYLGMRAFAHSLGAKSMWSHLWVALVFAAIIGVIGAVAMHYSQIPKLGLYSRQILISFVSLVCSGAFAIAAMLVALRVRNAVGPVYHRPFAWTTLALSMVGITAFHEFITKAFFTISRYAAADWSLWPYLAVGILLLITGMVYMEANREDIALPTDASYIDIVTSVAAMVTKPQDVDKMLDMVRSITASRTAEQLTGEDKSALMDVYIELENYLVSKEPLHKFTTVALRDSLPEPFLSDLITKEAAA